MTLFRSMLVVLAVAGVHSLELTERIDTSLRQIQSGELRYGIYNISPGQDVVEEEFTGPREATYADFSKDLRRTNPAVSRFGVINFEYIERQPPRKKVVAFLWSPRNQPEEQRRKYLDHLLAAFKDGSKPKIYGVESFVIADKEEDLNVATVSKQIQAVPTIDAL